MKEAWLNRGGLERSRWNEAGRFLENSVCILHDLFRPDDIPAIRKRP
jgi:hypothetical protein